MFTGYWLADLCAKEGITFVLGHALYMREIHGGKAKNDRIDAHKIATLLCGGTIAQAYVYPPEMRATRDLMRRRNHLMRKRSDKGIKVSGTFLDGTAIFELAWSAHGTTAAHRPRRPGLSRTQSRQRAPAHLQKG
jgi:hypothetical protein